MKSDGRFHFLEVDEEYVYKRNNFIAKVLIKSSKIVNDQYVIKFIILESNQEYVDKGIYTARASVNEEDQHEFHNKFAYSEEIKNKVER